MIAPLFGAMSNYHAGIANLVIDPGTWDPVFDRTRDPGAGAISNYVGYSFQSSYPVSAGEEMFISYGNIWYVIGIICIVSTKGTSLTRNVLSRWLGRPQFAEVPMKKNFDEAGGILASVWSLLASIEAAAIKEKDISTLLRLIRDRLIDPTLIRTKSALNGVQSIDDLQHAFGRNGTARATVQARSPEWLDENGKKGCIGHSSVSAAHPLNMNSLPLIYRILPGPPLCEG
jgi:hypothetical protein